MGGERCQAIKGRNGDGADEQTEIKVGYDPDRWKQLKESIERQLKKNKLKDRINLRAIG